MSTTQELQKRVVELEAELAQLKVFRQAAEAAGQGLGVTSLEGAVVYMNPALCRILGVANLEEALGQPITPYYPPDMQQRFQTEVLSAVMQQGQWVGELALVSAAGQVTPTLENFSVICDEQGRPLYLADVIAPIAARKQVEMRQEEKYRKLIETTDTGFVITDGQGNILDANQNYVNLTGYPTLDEIKGRSVTSWFAPYEAEKNAAAVQQCLEQCLEQGFIRDMQIDYIKPDGRITPVEINATVINTETGVQVLSLMRDITERKQVEDARRESEAKYSAVVNQARDGVILVQDDLCRFVNKALAEMLGYTPPEMENTPFVRFVASESRELVAGRIKARLAGQDVPAFYEAKLLRQDGTMIDVELSAGIIQYRGKTADIGLIRDITERKRIEAVLRRREYQQTAILDGMFQFIALLDPAGAILRVNRAAIAASGLTAAELEGLPFWEGPWWKISTAAQQQVQRALQETTQGVFTRYDVDVLTVGGPITIDFSLNPVKDESGQVVLMVAEGRDITAVKRAQAERERLNLAIEQTSEGIIITTTAGQVQYANPAWARMHGYEVGELIGQNFSICHTPEQRAQEVQPLLDQVTQTGIYEGEIGHKRRDGSTFPTWMTVSLIKDEAGQPLGVIGNAAPWRWP